MVCYPTLGGSGVVATELGKSLARRGHVVHFITYGVPSRLRNFEENVFFHKVEPGDYPLFQNASPYTLSFAAKIREMAVQCDLDLVHAHYAIPYATSAFLAKEMLKRAGRDLKTITTLHGTDITLVGLMPSFYEITRFSISVSDAITAVSRFLQRETIAAFNIEKPVEVIHNFVDAAEFRPVGQESLRSRFARPDEGIIIHVSNFRKVKNVPTVVDVFCEVRRERPAKLLLVGDGPELEAIERMVAERAIGDDVVFLGDQEFVASILPSADVFLLPSDHESFGLAALEAMSCGLCVVATSNGGLHEVVEDGESGFLFDPRDVAGMSAMIVRLLDDADRRREVGAKARERAVREFGREKIVDRYVALYESLL